MKHIWRNAVLLAAMITGSVHCLAQEKETQRNAPPPPPPAAEYSPAAWSTHKSAEGRFTVSMPGKPTEQTQSYETQIGKLDGRIYSLQTVVAVYLIAYTDFPRMAEGPDAAKHILDGGRDMALANSKGRLVSEKEISLNGYLGREVNVDYDDSTLRSRLYLVKQRLYQVIIVMPKAPATIRDSQDVIEFQNSTATKFLDSFTLIGAKEEK